ncbi:TPA: hypothetical protein ACQQ5N_002856 [Pseudomonas aeruginosa]|jgi:hypothetical protein|nr:hypothetical protein [Pseudomonas aeruginosa]
MRVSTFLQLMILVSLGGVNYQLFTAASSLPAQLEQLAKVSGGVELPADVQRKLDEIERLRATNAALQAIVANVNFGTGKESDPARVESFLPPLPTPEVSSSFTPMPATLQAFFSGEKASAEPATAPVENLQEEKKQGEAAGRMLITPIRFRENGALVYLASDSIVRVVGVNGQVYGVNGRYLGEKDGMAEFEMLGRRFTLPLIVAQSSS